MKKIILLMAFVGSAFVGSAQNFGVGVQSSFYTHGISAKLKMGDYNAVQAIVSLLGPFSSYTARYLKSFEEHDLGSSVMFQPYVVGMGSMHSITVKDAYGRVYSRSSSFGYGIGGGVTWHFDAFENFEISNEIAWTTTATALTGYNWSYIHYGLGLHYYFGN